MFQLVDLITEGLSVSDDMVAVLRYLIIYTVVYLVITLMSVLQRGGRM